MAQELLARAVKRELVGLMIVVDPESGKFPLMGHTNCRLAVSVMDSYETSVGWTTSPVKGLV